MAVADSISEVELDQYQRAVRVLLTEPLITDRYPDRDALPLVRRWAVQLSADLRAVLGHRLELGPTCARLVRSLDDLDPSQPAKTPTGRPFDRTRYAYLALALAVLGRSAQQLALTELADSVRAEANAVPGLGFDPAHSAAERKAFVDAVTWLERRGAIQVADGPSRPGPETRRPVRRFTTSTMPSSQRCPSLRGSCSTSRPRPRC